MHENQFNAGSPGYKSPESASPRRAPLFTPQMQRQAMIGQQLAAHTLRPVTVQRQDVGPVWAALSVQREVAKGLSLQRQVLNAQLVPLQKTLPVGALEGALQRQANQQAAVPALTRPPSRPADWVQAAQLEVQRVADPAVPDQTRWMGSAERERHVGTLRTVGQHLAQGFKMDRGPAVQRYAEYGESLATLQRQPLTAGISRLVLSQVSPAERPYLQRAVDEALQRQMEQAQQDQQALHLQALQRQLAALDREAALPITERLRARQGGGSPLPAAVLRQLEHGLNHDLSRVRIHTDTEADLLAKKVNAVAFTSGQDIYFRSGTFDPNTKSGIELLAHEVTHTVQQAQGKVGPGIDADAGLEQEARRFGRQFAAGGQTSKRQARPAAGTRPGSAIQATGWAVQRRAAPTPGPAPKVLPGAGQLAVIKQLDGARLHASPQGAGQTGPVLPLGTKLSELSRSPDGWSHVVTARGQQGYVQSLRLTTELPDAGASLILVQPGTTAIGVAEQHYKGLVKPGQDLRFYVNVLMDLDQRRGTGAFQSGQTLRAGHALWVPGPALAQSLVGKVASGSYTGGLWAEAKSAIGNGPGANILRSVMESPQYIPEVLGELWTQVKEHWAVILGTTAALIGAELLVGALAAAPEPTTITKFLAVGLQGLITAVAGAGLAVGVAQAAKAGTRWLMQAWVAEGNAGKLKAASKAFLSMVGNLVVAVASVAGVRASAVKTGALAKMPAGSMNPAGRALALTPAQGQGVSAAKASGATAKVPKGPQNYIDNKY